MDHSKALYAKFHTISAVTADPTNKSLTVFASDKASHAYAIELPYQIVGGLIASLMAMAPKIAPGVGEKGADIQPLTLDSGQPFSLPDGRAGLEITVETAIRLPLVFPPEAIPVLRTALDKLEVLTRKFQKRMDH